MFSFMEKQFFLVGNIAEEIEGLNYKSGNEIIKFSGDENLSIQGEIL